MRPFETLDDDRYSFMAAGQIDHAKVASNREEYIQAFYETTGRTDIEFGDLIWISDFRPNIRMVDRFGTGRVFVGGGTYVVEFLSSPPHVLQMQPTVIQ